jgi:polyketide cyclase/dehydrase/lipid transport protein
MGRVRASIRVPGLASEAEALWYDTTRWPTFVDGLHHVVRVEGDWPHSGARVVWDSNPGGRGRVQERVVAYAAREGQTVDVEDEKIRGTQRVTFTPADGDVVIGLELRYDLKAPRPGMALVDLLFIRRPQRESLQRTLRRFHIEVASERESSV